MEFIPAESPSMALVYKLGYSLAFHVYLPRLTAKRLGRKPRKSLRNDGTKLVLLTEANEAIEPIDIVICPSLG